MGSYGQVVRVLQPIIIPIMDALDVGLQTASKIHADLGYKRGDDAWFYAHAARRQACKELMELGLEAVDEDSGKPAMAMSGLLVHYQGIALKILRWAQDQDGRRAVPLPGPSLRRQQFYRQDSALDGFQTDNIILLWGDQDGRLIEPMTLVRPLGGTDRRDSLRLQWRGPLSRDMAHMRAKDLDMLRAAAEYPELGMGRE